MVLSDAPIKTSGLGRITRELLKRMRMDPETAAVFRVASLGCGQRYFKSEPYPQYPTSITTVITDLHDAWKDFSRGEPGVLFTIWNPSWLSWLSSMQKPPFNLWGYFPIDAEGPKGTLPKSQMDIINAFDRKLAYTKWAGDMIGAPFLPHGIDTSIYYPRQLEVKDGMIQGPVVVPEDTLRIGVCATNTPRKDWGLAAEMCSILKERGRDVILMAHTDTAVSSWNLPELFEEFDVLQNCVISTKQFTEDEMAQWYSACNVTLGIGSGEGFGYPIAESLACGVPCIHGNYAGGAEITPYRIDPIGWRYEGYTTDKRPIFDVNDWASYADHAWPAASLPAQFDWVELWPKWKEWLLKGVQ